MFFFSSKFTHLPLLPSPKKPLLIPPINYMTLFSMDQLQICRECSLALPLSNLEFFSRNSTTFSPLWGETAPPLNKIRFFSQCWSIDLKFGIHACYYILWGEEIVPEIVKSDICLNVGQLVWNLVYTRVIVLPLQFFYPFVEIHLKSQPATQVEPPLPYNTERNYSRHIWSDAQPQLRVGGCYCVDITSYCMVLFQLIWSEIITQNNLAQTTWGLQWWAHWFTKETFYPDTTITITCSETWGEK